MNMKKDSIETDFKIKFDTGLKCRKLFFFLFHEKESKTNIENREKISEKSGEALKIKTKKARRISWEELLGPKPVWE